MKEVFERKKEAVEYSPKLSKELLQKMKKRSSAKTPSGILLGSIKKIKNSEDFNLSKLDLLLLLDGIYQKVYEVEKKIKIPIIEIEIIDGWKGTDSLDFNKGFENDIVIKEHRKDKDTGEVITTPHTIPFEQVNRILFIVNKLKIAEKVYYRKVVSNLISMYDLQIGLDAFNGGRNRSRYYFPIYYFPVKILEKLKIIHYSGRGVITRLK